MHFSLFFLISIFSALIIAYPLANEPSSPGSVDEKSSVEEPIKVTGRYHAYVQYLSPKLLLCRDPYLPWYRSYGGPSRETLYVKVAIEGSDDSKRKGGAWYTSYGKKSPEGGAAGKTSTREESPYLSELLEKCKLGDQSIGKQFLLPSLVPGVGIPTLTPASESPWQEFRYEQAVQIASKGEGALKNFISYLKTDIDNLTYLVENESRGKTILEIAFAQVEDYSLPVFQAEGSAAKQKKKTSYPPNSPVLQWLKGGSRTFHAF